MRKEREKVLRIENKRENILKRKKREEREEREVTKFTLIHVLKI